MSTLAGVEMLDEIWRIDFSSPTRLVHTSSIPGISIQNSKNFQLTDAAEYEVDQCFDFILWQSRR